MTMRTSLLLLIFLFTGWHTNAAEPPMILWTEEMLKSMSVDEKIGQLFMIAAYSNGGSEEGKVVEEAIRKYGIGGVIFFQGEPLRQVQLTNRYQQLSKFPLLIGLDAEHGAGWRLKTAMEFPKMQTNGAIADDSLIFRLGQTIAKHCRELGVHVNFAPSADVNNNPLNPVIGNRSFGENRENVYRKASMYIKGSLAENVLPVVKHFPGHGDTDTDSHVALPVIRHSRNRLDSTELYPFRRLIADGVPAIMTAHLNVHSLDPENRPASLSPAVIDGLLKREWGFNGLCFTDALNMKGVTTGREPGEAELQALLAGNDILLFPENIGQAARKIKEAIRDSLFSEADLNRICRRILMAKYQYVRPCLVPASTAGLWSRLNTPEDFALKNELYKNAVTLVKNEGELLPLKGLDTLSIACVNFGSGSLNHFQTMLENYAPVHNIAVSDRLSENELNSLIQKLSAYNCILIYNSKASDRISQKFGYSPQLETLLKRLQGQKTVLCHPATPYGLTPYIALPADAVLVTYEDHIYARQYAAQAIFGGIALSARLPVSVSPAYPAGHGISTRKTRLGYALPEMCRVSGSVLEEVDTVCLSAIRSEATPGCQVLVARDGYIIYNKSFGHHTYQKESANHPADVYDLASVSKVTATLPVIMQLFDKGRIELDAPLSRYYPALAETNKKEITVREALTHTAGLKTHVSSFSEAVDKESITGNLFTAGPTKFNTLKLKDRLYFNPNYKFRAHTLARTARPEYSFLTPGLYIYREYRDSLLFSVLRSELNAKKEYLYSDLGMILLQKAAESVSGESLDVYCADRFYKKLGTTGTAFLPAVNLKGSRIVPSSFDHLYRKSEVKGYVHDPMAVMLGGVAGHAGLFSNATDLAKIMQLYLNGGSYGGDVFFSPETVRLFTSCCKANRRGLGFDKPETDPKKSNPACEAAPVSSFGHTGFTGTMVWADPENQLVYIFLSNRTYPNEFNGKLSEGNVRTRIQGILYRSLK
jgi:beta-glucosidase-like glycosyl hydrolase/CubicO group peptidase (beta-lactamase class C family)